MDDISTIEHVPKPKAILGIRHLQYLLMFSGAVVVYGMRTVLNVAIVAMLNKEEDATERNYPVYPEWQDHKNVMLSCFSWGHIWFQILAGQIAKNYGPKYYLTAAIIISSACILVIPWFAATVGYKGIIAVRVIEGAFHGVLFPSVHFLLSKWAPVWERAKWGSFVYAGQVLGNCLAMPITGMLCDTNSGWPLAFYFYGCLGMAWSLLWLLLGSNTPGSDKRISSEERKWIESGTVIAKIEIFQVEINVIFTSVPFIAIIITHCGQNWGFWTLLTEIPSFMKEILHYKNTANGVISALPYFIMWLMNLWWSPIADYIIKRKYVTLAASRKIFNSIGDNYNLRVYSWTTA
ncbi:unnamed protein product [Phaedon cochleariae]|uniref:Major facilitator superfamily (MFS) profile domain-containing protein n=1 Tax=Phaedon cochleariae TaxID=80249 RepID=A0A9P0DLG4_PHACE|nr:unnamed protein product [Phaedon cochleariae]